MSIDPAEFLDSFISESYRNYCNNIGYEPIDLELRNPEDSDLDWDFYSEARNERMLVRYPPKLLDRMALVAASQRNVSDERTLGEKYAEVDSDENSCRMILENEYGAAGVEAERLGGNIFFSEYLADERKDIKFKGSPERSAYADLPEDIIFDDFFEGLQIERDALVVRQLSD